MAVTRTFGVLLLRAFHQRKKSLLLNMTASRKVCAFARPAVYRHSRSLCTVQPDIPSSVTTMNDKGAYLELIISGLNSPLRLNYMWLRDHCYCKECYNSYTFQRNFDTFDLKTTVKPKNINQSDDSLVLTWEDGHISSYDVQWLVKNSYDGYKQVKQNQKTLWNGNSVNPLFDSSTVPYENYMKSEDGVKSLLKAILNLGFGIVTEMPATLEATQEIAERICAIQCTLFGKVWQFTSDNRRSDTAYTNISIGAHTDSTYLYNFSGIQMFHCLHHDGEGGKTLLVDAFNAAEILRKTNPEAFHYLCEAQIPCEYIEKSGNAPDEHMHCISTTIQVNPVTKEPHRIRYNLYDKAPLFNIPVEEMAKFYSSINAFTAIIRDPASEFWVKLQPGMTLFVDNWRVMHGRSKFTGKREVCGCYLPRDGYMSKARVYGLV